jgi:hypothetical protein
MRCFLRISVSVNFDRERAAPGDIMHGAASPSALIGPGWDFTHPRHNERRSTLISDSFRHDRTRLPEAMTEELAHGRSSVCILWLHHVWLFTRTISPTKLIPTTAPPRASPP